MLFTTAAIVSSISFFGASAAPLEARQDAKLKDYDAFNLLTIRSGSPIQNGAVSAAHRGLLVNLPAGAQNADCYKPTNTATFFLAEGELILYTEENPPQTVFVDRSGMGKGLISYKTGAEALPRYAETKGWNVTDTNVLKFGGVDVQACPGSFNGSYSLWLGGFEQPGNIEGCIGILGKAIKAENPISCYYTTE
jgi:hypothetical protein